MMNTKSEGNIRKTNCVFITIVPVYKMNDKKCFITFWTYRIGDSGTGCCATGGCLFVVMHSLFVSEGNPMFSLCHHSCGFVKEGSC